MRATLVVALLLGCMAFVQAEEKSGVSAVKKEVTATVNDKKQSGKKLTKAARKSIKNVKETTAGEASNTVKNAKEMMGTKSSDSKDASCGSCK